MTSLEHTEPEEEREEIKRGKGDVDDKRLLVFSRRDDCGFVDSVVVVIVFEMMMMMILCIVDDDDVGL